MSHLQAMKEINLSLFGERLKAVRTDLGLSQAEAADLVGLSRERWGKCERGAGLPGGEALAALAMEGVDVNHLLTGKAAADVSPLTTDERELLALFRAAPLAVKAAAVGALQGAASAAPNAQRASRGGVNQMNTGHGAIQIGTVGGKRQK